MTIYLNEVHDGNLYQMANQEYVSKGGNDHIRTVYLVNGKRKSAAVFYALRSHDIAIEAARSC